jgi:hypothetical protein
MLIAAAHVVMVAVMVVETVEIVELFVGAIVEEVVVVVVIALVGVRVDKLVLIFVGAVEDVQGVHHVLVHVKTPVAEIAVQVIALMVVPIVPMLVKDVMIV